MNRPRDRLGRPLSPGSQGEPDVDARGLSGADAVGLARDLLEDGRPFAAHEVLETRWKEGPPEERDLWQGLAQLAVSCTHAARGNAIGAERLRLRASERLAAYTGPSYGLDLTTVASDWTGLGR